MRGAHRGDLFVHRGVAQRAVADGDACEFDGRVGHVEVGFGDVRLLAGSEGEGAWERAQDVRCTSRRSSRR